MDESMRESEMHTTRGRNVPIDFLRCILMFLIVLHHSSFHGCYANDSRHWLLPLLFTYLIFWHVDGFVAISGWFGTRFSLTRLFNILGVVFFWTVARDLVVYFTQGKLPGRFAWAAGWYGSAYISFLFVAPLLNAAIEKLVESRGKRLYICLAIFNLGLLLNWLPYVPISLGGGAYSIVMIIGVYINARVVKLKGCVDVFSKRTMMICSLLYLLGVSVCSGFYVVKALVRKGFALQSDWIGLTIYSSPHSMVMGIAVVLFFVKYVRIRPAVSKIVERIAPLMFGVYIIHEGTGIGRCLYRIPQSWLIAHTDMNPVAIVFATAIMALAACLVCESLRRLLVAPLRKCLVPRLKELDARFLS